MMSMMMSINMLMIFINHPLSMGMLLITQTILTSIMTGMIMNTFWMSYILLITMLSGSLVLFIYMSSMASNEKFMNKMTLWTMMLIIISMGMLMFLFLEEKMIIKNNYLSMGMNDIFFLNSMFNMKNSYIIIMLVIYLLITMIVSTSLVNIFEGPMRTKM